MSQAKRDQNRVTTLIGVDEATLAVPTLVGVTTNNELLTFATTTPASQALQFAVNSGTATTLYLGTAVIASATSGAVWAMQEIDTISGNVAITWADGNSNADNVWDDRESLSYS